MADLRFYVTQEGTLNQGGSGNDTVFNYTGTFSADTVKGSGGNDLIQLANQTTAVTIRGNYSAGGSAAGWTAGFLQAVYSAANVSGGKIQTVATARTSLSALETDERRSLCFCSVFSRLVLPSFATASLVVTPVMTASISVIS